MSAEATNWVWKHSGAAGSDRLVLLALADFCNEKAECYASYGTLVKKTKLSPATIYRSLKSLRDMGEIVQLTQGALGNGGEDASEWHLPKCQNEVTFNLNASCLQSELSTIHNNTDNNSSSPTARPQPPKLTVVKESNSPLSLKPKRTSQRKREDVLGKGLSDDEWMASLATQYPHINIPVLFDRCLGWCRERSKVASRRQFMAFVRNAKEDRPMQVSKPQTVVGQSAWDRELEEIRRAAGE